MIMNSFSQFVHFLFQTFFSSHVPFLKTVSFSALSCFIWYKAPWALIVKKIRCYFFSLPHLGPSTPIVPRIWTQVNIQLQKCWLLCVKLWITVKNSLHLLHATNWFPPVYLNWECCVSGNPGSLYPIIMIKCGLTNSTYNNSYDDKQIWRDSSSDTCSRMVEELRFRSVNLLFSRISTS